VRIAGCRALLSLGAPAFCERGFSRRAAAYRRGARPRGATGPPSHCQSRVQCAASRDGPQRGCRAARHRGGGRGSRGRCGRVEARVLHRGVAVVSVASRIAAWRSVGGVGGGGAGGAIRGAEAVERRVWRAWSELWVIFMSQSACGSPVDGRMPARAGFLPHMAVVGTTTSPDGGGRTGLRGAWGEADLRGIGGDFDIASDDR